MKMRDKSLFVAGTAVLATVTLLSAGMPDDKHLVDWVQKRVRGLQPSRAERRIDEIGWAHGILEAEGLARALNRPVFLFTHDGRIETGRC
jgi:hypothetical protein